MTQQLQSDICTEHQAEFKASAIADDIIAHNLRSFEPSTNPNDTGSEYELDEIFGILIDNPEHINNGTLSGTAQQSLANTLRCGGWVFEGYKGKNVKPNEPRKGKQKKIIDDDLKLAIKQKFIKYESVRGKGNQQILIPHITVRASLLIAENLQIANYVPSSEDPSAIDTNFWDRMAKCDYPIFITEGVKKTLSIISNGFPAIGLNGVSGWSNGKDDDGKRLIHQELLPFLNKKREWIIAFDIDKSPRTVKSVNAEKLAFCNCVKDKADKVNEIKWNSTHKGIDDCLASFPEDKRETELYKIFINNRSEVEDLKIDDKQDKKDAEAAQKQELEKQLEEQDSRFSSSIEEDLIEIQTVKTAKGYENVPVKIGNHLEAIARVNNPDETDATLLLEFKTYHGSIKRWGMSRGFLGGDSRDITSELLRLGYHYERGHKQSLLTYLHGLGSQLEQAYTVTESSGWVRDSFVLPHKTHGDPDLRFRDVDPSPDAITEVKGTLQGWIDNVAARCANNSRLILGLGCSFAAPLLPIVDIESGGFHLVGETSNGKTTILSVAASVTGIKVIPSWRTTDNALEGGLAAFNHLCMPLDELKQCEARAVGSVVYMLGNGIGKSRANKNLTNRKSKTWLTIVLSSGELTIGDKMKECGQTIAGGQEVRLPDVPAIPKDSKNGCFETIHGASRAAQFVASLEAEVKRHHGTALDAFLTRLVIDKPDPQFADNLSKQVHLLAARLAEGTKDTAIARVAKRFALVQVALGLAHKYGLLPFDAGQIDWAISTCFKDWLDARGGDGSIEIKNAIKRIEHLLVSNEFGDRVYHLHDGDDNKVRNLLAYRKSVAGAYDETEEFWVPPAIFDKEFCDGVNKTELVKELQRMGWLKISSDGKSACRERVNQKQSRFYVFQWNNFQESEKTRVTGVTGVTDK
jgi:putative DNA primase/helicase